MKRFVVGIPTSFLVAMRKQLHFQVLPDDICDAEILDRWLELYEDKICNIVYNPTNEILSVFGLDEDKCPSCMKEQVKLKVERDTVDI